LPAGAAGASPARVDLATLLRRSETADARVDYSGTKVVVGTRGHHHRKAPEDQAGPHERTVHIWHLRPDQTRIEFVAGGPPGGTIIQHGNDHWVRGPRGDFRRFPREPSVGGVDLLLQNYALRKLKTETVAGRPALVIAVEPRHPGNPHKIVWLDTNTNLTLKTQLFNSAGELTEESEFSEIDYHPSFPPHHFDVPGGMNPVGPPAPVSLDFVPKRPDYLPPGYILIRTSSFRDRHARLVAYLRYTDGLNTLSLFETRAGPNEDSEWFRGPAIKGVAGDLRFAIVADLSPAELNKVAGALSRPH
jgi:outer membrane lipoprotein-sorting protein